MRERLASLLGRAPSDAEVKAARRLFAQTLEAKGGLKIYTIHGFCERLLQRFPLEAQVTPHFAVLDESEALRLKGAAFDATMARAAKERDGPLGAGARQDRGGDGGGLFPQDRRHGARQARRR